VNGLFELFVNIGMAVPAGFGDVSGMYTGAWILNGQNVVLAMTIFAGRSNGRGSRLSRILAVNAVHVGSDQQLPVFHSFDLSGMRLVAGSTDLYLIEGIYFRLKAYIMGSMTIPAVWRRRFRPLQHFGMPAPGNICCLFLMASLALRFGQRRTVRQLLRLRMAIDAVQFIVGASGDPGPVHEQI